MSEQTTTTQGGCCGGAPRTASPRPDDPDDPDALRQKVSAGYAKVAQSSGGCCGGGSQPSHAEDYGKLLGYGDDDLAAIPDGANLALGCGNPTQIAALRTGETVVDLGSGAGMDVFVAAAKVGPTGRAIGIDMTDAMLERARDNAARAGITNVEFRKGIIEELPLEDGSVDVILSNCVINLSPEKPRVFADAYRVLKPGGRLMVSDILLEQELPQVVRDSLDAYIGCVGGAVLKDEYRDAMEQAGFSTIELTRKGGFGDVLSPDDPNVAEAMKTWGLSVEQVRDYGNAVASYAIFAVK